MQKLEKLPRIKSSNDIYGLRKIYDQIEVCARNLKALNIATYGAILAPFLNGVNSLDRKNILLLLDSGSQRSYISEKLRNELNLPTLRRERLFIKTFGNSNSKCKNVDIVPLNVITSNKTITIEAICAPDICDPLTNQNVKAVSTNYNHLKNLKLADLSNRDTKSINILIGLDYYYLFVTGDSISGEPNDPIPLNSNFGWILCGTFVEITQANFNVTHLFRVDTLRNKTAESPRKEILLSLISTAIMTPASRCFRKTIINKFLRILKKAFNLKIIATLQNCQLGK